VVVSLVGQILYFTVSEALATSMSLLLPFAYFGYANGELGQTIGKWLLGLAVVDATSGQRVGFARGAGRHLTMFVLLLAFILPGLIDVLFPLWDPRGQALHDKAMRTMVVGIPRP
jgi:uncharacterized RDD family membrane protein YckC